MAVRTYQLKRECLSALRRVTVPTFKGLYMRFFMASDVKSFSVFCKSSVSSIVNNHGNVTTNVSAMTCRPMFPRSLSLYQFPIVNMCV